MTPLESYQHSKLRKRIAQYVQEGITYTTNTAGVRDMVVANISSIIGSSVNVHDYKVSCSENNNKLVVDIFIKPNKAAEFIYFPITQTE